MFLRIGVENDSEPLPVAFFLSDGVHVRHQRRRVRHHREPRPLPHESEWQIYVVSSPGKAFWWINDDAVNTRYNEVLQVLDC